MVRALDKDDAMLTLSSAL